MKRVLWVAVVAVLVLGALGQGNSSPDWHVVRVGDVCLRVPGDWYDYTPAVRKGPDDDGVTTVALWMSNSAGADAVQDMVGLRVLSTEDPSGLEILRDLDGADDFERIEEYEALFAGRSALWTLYHVTNLYDVTGLEGRMWFVNHTEPQTDGTYLLFFGVEPLEPPGSESIIRSILLSAAACAGEDRPTCTIVVRPGESIQAAIDAASPGDVICLAAGEWEENLVIEKSLTLRAAEIASEPLAVIRSARWGWPVIRIASEEPIEVTLQGLMIKGAFGDCYREDPDLVCAVGVASHGRATVTIESNTISDNDDGIGMWGSSHATIEGNTIRGNWGSGILMSDFSLATIDGNTICDSWVGVRIEDFSQASLRTNIISGHWFGIRMAGSSQATIEHNTISDNTDGILMEDSSQATVTSNTISGNDYAGVTALGTSQATVTSNDINDNEHVGIWILGLSKATIEHNSIRDNWVGIWTWEASQAAIEDNSISGNRWGIRMWESSQATIGDNSISGNEWGILMAESAQATIESNTIRGNETAIQMAFSSQATVKNNVIYGNTVSIWMWGSSQATIESNTISGSASGIGIWSSSQAAVRSNTISGNANSIEMGDHSQATIEDNTIRDNSGGVRIADSSQATVTNNVISGNRLFGIVLLGLSRATITGNVIRDNEYHGIGLWERVCFDITKVFTGYVTGGGNSGGGNFRGDACPADLAFLFTEEGGELDRRR